MALIHACDRCGTAGMPKPRGDFEQVGMVRPHIYCATCTPIMQGFLRELDALHDRVAADFKAGLDALKATALEGCPDGLLPDA